MSLERAIHERWEATPELNTTVPAARVFTGEAHGATQLPYVVLDRPGARVVGRTSSGTQLWEERLTLHAYGTQLNQTRTIVEAARGQFARLSLEVDGGVCVCIQAARSDEAISGDGVWRTSLELAGLVAR